VLGLIGSPGLRHNSVHRLFASVQKECKKPFSAEIACSHLFSLSFAPSRDILVGKSGVEVMAQTVNQLTATKVQKVKAPGMYPDGAGLYLQVTAGPQSPGS